MRIGPAPEEFGDWDGLLSLILESFAYMEGRIDPPSSALRLTPQALTHRARAEHLYLATGDNALLGCAFFAPQGDALYIGKLAVSPAAQRRGVGARLVAAAETLAHDLNLRCLLLETRIELTGNHAAFARMGFEKVGEKAHPGFARPTSITMEKPLW